MSEILTENEWELVENPMAKPLRSIIDRLVERVKVLEGVAMALCVKREHYYCEDTWYSCPKHPEGCANKGDGDKCNCGEDKWNAKVDAALTVMKGDKE